MAFYRIVMALALPLLLAGALWRRLTGRGVAGELAERLGRAPGPGPALWLHGASNGEITSARWLLEDVLARHPGLRVVVTCNNPTARRMVQGWALPGVTAQLAPWDTRGAVARFLRHWQPRALIVIENELWPERLAACAAAAVPVIAIGARMSAGSARNWGRIAPGLMRRMLAALTFVTAQDAASEARLVALGLPPGRLGPRLMLKAAVADSGAAEPAFASPVPRARCLLAASTHEGEEELILAAYAAARAAGAFDLMILAPRHPARGDAVAALITGSGLSCTRRSAGAVPEGAVYLADTLGEMPLWYAMAGVAVIGATFVPKGGHTPFEPAAWDCALVHGPSVTNFTEIFAALDAAGGALAVADGPALAAALLTLDAPAQARMAAAARAALPARGDATPLHAAIDAALGKAQPSGYSISGS